MDAPAQPYVKLVEQPARCALRFRYECEGRSAGSIPGANSTADNKTFPTIQIQNYKGQAVCVVSCVTKDAPHRPHPHNLVGKEGCKKGVCTVVINNPDMTYSFTSLGIQCVKRKDVEESLRLRESIKVDPFRTGFAHKNQASNIDLNVVRLCFQIFIEGPEKDKFTVPLQPIVCDPIYDKKAMSELVITKLSHCSATVSGGKEVILLCDRVTKDDIQIRFFEEQQGQLVWEALADFQPNDVHKQVAITFRTPKYYVENIQLPICVQIQLRRPSDNHCSESRPFQLIPKEVDPNGLARKRQKVADVDFDHYVLPSQSQQQQQQQLQQAIGQTEFVRVPRFTQKIKHELPETLASSSQPTCSGMWAVPDPPNQVSFNLSSSLIEPSASNVKKEATNESRNFAHEHRSVVDGPLTEKMDSLDLDIDPNDLISDINFNNLMVNLDSGNNITFNSSGNIMDVPSSSSAVYATLNTPQIVDDNRNPLSQFSPPNDSSSRNLAP